MKEQEQLLEGTVWLRSDGAGYDIGINPRTTAANTVWSSGTQTINTTLFVVISYQIVSGTSNDVVNLWINPTPGSSMPAATHSATNSGTDLANLNRILLRQDAATTTPFVEMDELRVGTTWADVTPAGATINLLASPSSLSGFNYIETAGPSVSQNFVLSGTNLNGTDVTLSAPTNYQISEDNSSFSNSITLTAYNGNNKTLYVRLKSGLTAGSYNSENITISGGGDTDGASVSCSGNVSPLTISFNVSTASITENGVSYTIQVNTNAMGSHTADIVVTGGTATNGNQYAYTTATATFAASMIYTTNVTINNNSVCASATNTIFGLSGLTTGLTLGANTSLTLTINDDDLIIGNQYVQDFDGTTPVWTYTGSGSVATTYGKTNNGIRIGETQSFTLNNVSTVGMNNLKLLLNDASVGGIENNDALKIYVALNGASFSSTPDIQIQEGNPSDSNYNKSWTYSANNTAATTAGTPATFTGDGVNGYAKVEITIPNGTTSISVKIESANNVNDEYYYIDDIRLYGEICNICTEPTADAVFWSNSPQNIMATSVDLHWTNGDGTSRMVLLHEATPVTYVPVDTQTYNANANFSAGIPLSDGSKVVYNGSSSTVALSGLTPGSIYHAEVFEYGCTAGNENYYTTGTPTTDIFVTTPENPSTLDRGCINNTSITLNWSAPASGTFEGYLLTVREGTTPSSVNSIDPSSITTANTDYSSAGAYGTSSYYLYKGTGTSVNITGLTSGLSYTFKLYTYTDAGTIYEYSSGTTTTPVISLINVSSAYTIGGDTQAILAWNNPTLGCFDDVLIVANETAGIDFTPIGNGSSYIPNTSYGGVNSIVYNQSASTVTVTGLTNGTTYYFEIFVNNGTEWSTGVEVSVVPNAGTLFKAGELVFVGYDAQYLGSGADDEYLIANLVDLKPGTTFSLVNSRYEAGAAANVRTDKWGGAGDDASMNPGVAIITYTGAVDIPAGSILIFHTDSTLGVFDYVGVITGTTTVDETSNFSTSLPFGSSSAPNISSGDSDQIFLVQGGFTFDGTADAQQANYVLNGILLHGITNRAAWVPLTSACNGDASGGNTRESRLHPGLNCFSVENQSVSARSGFYQNSQIHTGSLRNIILGISNASYWTLGTGGYTTDPTSTAINRAGHTFTITGGNAPGTWVSSSDTNWFNCANWENLAVPDENADVIISNSYASVNPVINYVASYSDLFSDVAQTKNLSIQGLKLILEGNISNKLEVYGDLTLQTSGSLDMDDNTSTDDGQLYVFGNWDNQVGASAFEEGNGTIHFMGTSMQSVSCNSDTEKFYNVVLNNPIGFSTDGFNSDLHAEGSLTLTQGNLTVKSGHYALAAKNLTVAAGSQIQVENQGSLIQTGNGTVSGGDTSAFKVTKTTGTYYEYDYIYWSSPIENQAIQDVFKTSDGFTNYKYQFNPAAFNDENSGEGYDQTSGPGDGYDDEGDDWISFASGTMEEGLGYIVMGKGSTFPFNISHATNLEPGYTVSFMGQKVNNGDVEVSIYKDNSSVIDVWNTNLNFVGNPYPSSIDIGKLYDENDANIETGFYFWAHSAPLGATTGPNAYDFSNTSMKSGSVTLNGSNYEFTAADPTYQSFENIASGQGFFVSAKESIVNNGSVKLKFTNAMRAIDQPNTSFLRTSNNASLNRIWLSLNQGTHLKRNIAIGFGENLSDTYGMGDTPRFDSATDTDFYSLIAGHDLGFAVQFLSTFNIEKTVPLGMEVFQSGMYQIQLEQTDGIFNQAQSIYLEDTYQDIIHDLGTSPYTFTQSAGTNINDRFILRFTNSALGNEETAFNQVKVYPNPSNGVFNIAYYGSETLQYTIYDLTGKTVMSGTGNTINLSQQAIGLYVAKITDGTAVRTLKLMRE
jgi:hypothetical protein